MHNIVEQLYVEIFENFTRQATLMSEVTCLKFVFK